MKPALLPSSFLLMRIGRYVVGLGDRVVFFTRPRLRECLALAGTARFQIRAASIYSADSGSFSSASLGDCLLEERPNGLGALDVRWFARSAQVLRHGTHPACSVTFGPEGTPSAVTDVFLTRKPLPGTDEFGQPMTATDPFIERADRQ